MARGAGAALVAPESSRSRGGCQWRWRRSGVAGALSGGVVWHRWPTQTKTANQHAAISYQTFPKHKPKITINHVNLGYRTRKTTLRRKPTQESQIEDNPDERQYASGNPNDTSTHRVCTTNTRCAKKTKMRPTQIDDPSSLNTPRLRSRIAIIDPTHGMSQNATPSTQPNPLDMSTKLGRNPERTKSQQTE